MTIVRIISALILILHLLILGLILGLPWYLRSQGQSLPDHFYGTLPILPLIFWATISLGFAILFSEDDDFLCGAGPWMASALFTIDLFATIMQFLGTNIFTIISSHHPDVDLLESSATKALALSPPWWLLITLCTLGGVLWQIEKRTFEIGVTFTGAFGSLLILKAIFSYT